MLCYEMTIDWHNSGPEYGQVVVNSATAACVAVWLVARPPPRGPGRMAAQYACRLEGPKQRHSTVNSVQLYLDTTTCNVLLVFRLLESRQVPSRALLDLFNSIACVLGSLAYSFFISSSFHLEHPKSRQYHPIPGIQSTIPQGT